MSVRRWILCVVALILSFSSVAGESECSDSTSSNIKLQKQLLCNYDPHLRPVKDFRTPVNVSINIFVMFFLFSEYHNYLELHALSLMKWNDEFLVWNKSEHGGIEELLLKQQQIWIPDIDVTTSSRFLGSSHSEDTHCKVQHTGQVRCSRPTVYDVHCSPDVTLWPFDSHNCTMKLGALMTTIKEVNLTYIGAKGIVRVNDDSDNYWKFVESTARLTSEADKLAWPEITFSFLFVRHTNFYAATLFIPSVVMILGTLTIFCLGPRGDARFLVIGGNIICHCLFLLFLCWFLPGNGDSPPVIVIFTRDSFVLLMVALLITLCGARMKSAVSAPPAWICAITDGVIDTPGADYLLFTGLYAQSEEAEGEATSTDTFESLSAMTAKLKWDRLALLLDRTSCVIFAVILAILAFRFMP